MICRNTSLDLLRKRAPKVQNVLIVEPAGITSASVEEHKHVAVNAIKELTEREQQVLLPLFNLDGTTAQELSTQLGLSDNAVRQLRFRATKKLKKQLSKIGYTVRRTKIFPSTNGNEKGE